MGKKNPDLSNSFVIEFISNTKVKLSINTPKFVMKTTEESDDFYVVYEIFQSCVENSGSLPWRFEFKEFPQNLYVSDCE